MVKRVYVEKKKGFDAEANRLLTELKNGLGLPRLEDIRIISRYDVDGIDDETYKRAKQTVFFDSAVEIAYDEELPD
ncbi:MAG: hypothetical protein FWG09_06515, partial [Synergistaceae bacterium]|nr:hypothetical protein [Synergistaceae bacterium]